jgi:hypothetical protein
MRRSACGVGGEEFVDKNCRLRFDGACVDAACSDYGTRRQRMRPLRDRYSLAAVVSAATGAAHREFIRLRFCSVAVMDRLTKAAGMGLRGRSRQRHRNEIPGKREQQQEAGGQTLHVSLRNELLIGGKHRTRLRAGASTSLRRV